jgi:hypothetical protein
MESSSYGDAELFSTLQPPQTAATCKKSGR